MPYLNDIYFCCQMAAEERFLGNRLMLVGAKQGVSAFHLSLYIGKQRLSFFLLSSYRRQRLADFLLLPTISQHRLRRTGSPSATEATGCGDLRRPLASPCFLYLVRSRPVCTSLNERFRFSTVQLRSAGARGRFGQANEVKGRLHWLDLQRLSPLSGRPPLFL